VRVLLVSTYELGHQPLHLASTAAHLGRAGHEVITRDTSVEPLDDDAIDWAEMIAVAVPMHTAMRLAIPVVQRVRVRRGDSVTVVLYGLYAPLCRDTLGGAVDHRIGGEFEEELVAVASGARRSRDVVLDRLQFATPRRQGLPPLERYARLVVDGEERLAGYVEASRGCVHRCRHCPVPAVYDGRIRIVQVATLVVDVAALRDQGARHITFGDPDFLNAVPHALATVRAVHGAFSDLTFDITTKVEHVIEHADVFAELRDCGLLFVTSAVESMSGEVLRILDKGHTPGDADRAVHLLRSLGIALRPSLLPFTPWSDVADYLDIIDFIDGNDLEDAVDPVQLSIRLLVPDGSLLLQRAEMRRHLDGYDPATLSWRWRHPNAAVDALAERVAALVAGDVDAGVEASLSHRRIRDLAALAAADAGITWQPTTRPSSARAGAGPRLSEPWFCCAEPTTRQLTAVG
jgi:hypothetical protein